MNDRSAHHDEEESLDAALEEIYTIRRRLWEEVRGDVNRYIEQSRRRAERRKRERSDDQTRAA